MVEVVSGGGALNTEERFLRNLNVRDRPGGEYARHHSLFFEVRFIACIAEDEKL